MDILSFGLLGPTTQGSDPTRDLRLAIKRHCEELLPESIGLSDGFGFSDWELDRSVCDIRAGQYDPRAESVSQCPWSV